MAVKRQSRFNAEESKKSAKSPAKKKNALPSLSMPSMPKIDWEKVRADIHLYATIAAWIFLVLDIYLIASLFTSWTGTLGGAAKQMLVSRFGGGILIVLFFVGYLCLSQILQRKIPRPLHQLVGTASLYACATLLLGLVDLAIPGGLGFSFLVPGSWGRAMAGWSFQNLGPLGTMLSGLMVISLTLVCFGFTAFFSAIFNAFEKMGQKKKSRHETKKTPPAAQEDVVDEFDIPEVKPSYSSQPTQSDEDASAPGWDEDLLLPSPVDVVAVDEMPEDSAGISAPVGQFPPPFEVYGREQDDGDVISEEMARPWGERIINSLDEFGIEADLAEILIGPTVIQFRIQPSPGVKVSKIVSLANDLALALAVSSLRVEAPIPGKPYVGIEIPNPKRKGITLRSIIEEDEYQETDKTLPLPMGVTINGEPLIIGLEELPHLLVAGTTGSGKSVFVNSCIVGLCSMRKPDELKMVLVDPKRVEMAAYEKLPHILTPPVTDPKKAVHVLGWALREMERRYSCFAEIRVRNLASYNELLLPKDRLPHIVIVVDELADLMMTAAKEVEEYICRLAQMARATGIHLMLATQRPSVNVITGLIKANVPARVAFTLPSMMDSRTIIDSGGAEKLLGKGDMLFLSTQNPKPVRVQSPWIDEHSVARWIDYLVNMFGEPVYTDIEDQGDVPSGFAEGANFDDALLEEAVRVVTSTGMASASGLQRRLRIGFTRAGRLVDMMELAGIIGPADGARPREILVDEEEADDILSRLRGAN